MVDDDKYDRLTTVCNGNNDFTLQNKSPLSRVTILGVSEAYNERQSWDYCTLPRPVRV